MKLAKIDVTKILKEHLFQGKNGAKYLDIAIHDNRDGKDQYGNDGFITQSVSKEARERGEKGPIIGNWKELESRQSKPVTRPSQSTSAIDEDGDPIPF